MCVASPRRSAAPAARTRLDIPAADTSLGMASSLRRLSLAWLLASPERHPRVPARVRSGGQLSLSDHAR